ncbi:MAG: serine/threonine protein kinase [Acidobacteria bacterium]|nr:serine/threonine protein kinase [Acidobacteriota bacterium]
MGESPGGPGRHLDAPTVAPAAGVTTTATIGPYRLLEKLGEGGMGEVWLAEQTRPVHRQVALKVIKAGMDTARVVARFDAERQALALMSHPSIAQVFDAGATPEGRPYFAMEYVRGEPITDYCQRHRLTVRQRIDLFLEVCDAVQHAHQKGIIHRDLKPSNVLVTIRDDRPVPKVIDFGVAKATTQPLTERTMYTERGVLIGTLEYMSPEQAEMSGLDVDTRTDVYALGVILYELLTGALPFEPRELRKKPLDEIRRTIREVDPPRPSTRVTTSLGAATTDTGAPAPPIVVHAHQLRGDLDWIILRALEKDRTRRYGSASDLAADLRRHLLNLPVLACPPSLAYRLGKFVRRHRVAVSAAAILAVMVVGFVILMALQARQIARERDRAQTAQATAEQVTAFLVRMFEASDPSESRGDTVTARQLLETGVTRVGELDGQPEVQARLLDLMGRVYQSLGKYEEAQPLLERSLEVRRAALGAEHPAVAESLSHIGELSSLRGRYDEAETRLRDALVLHERTVGRESAEAAMDLQLLGAVMVDKGDIPQGRQLIEEALAIRRRVLPPGHLDLAESYAGLAYAASRSGDFEQMEHWHRESLTLLRQALGESHPRVALALNNLAAAIAERGRFAEAEQLHREALAMRRQLFGDEHPAVATSLNNLGNVLLDQGKLADAEGLYRQAVDLRKRLLGVGHPSTGTSLNNLGVLLYRAGKPAEAVPVMQEARVSAVSRLPEDHTLVLTIDGSIATMIAALGRDAEAEPLFQRTLATRIKSQGEDHPDVATSRLMYGRFLRERRRYAEAEPLLVRAFEVRRDKRGATHPDTVRAVQELATLYRATGREVQAVATEQAVKTR